MDITLLDVIRLQQEVGQVEMDLRLRAIVAERKVQELEAQVETLKKLPEKEIATSTTLS